MARTHRSWIVIALLVTCLTAGCGAGGGEQDAVVATAPAGSGGDAGDAPAGGGVLVDVAGRVRRPGVYRLPAGARVHEAIEAAGGARADADLAALNRAALVTDGQQVLVAEAGAGGGGEPDTGSSAGPVSINVADVAALDALPGIGPVTAQRIVDEREAGGPFASVDDLARVSGVGPGTIEALREAVTT